MENSASDVRAGRRPTFKEPAEDEESFEEDVHLHSRPQAQFLLYQFLHFGGKFALQANNVAARGCSLLSCIRY